MIDVSEQKIKKKFADAFVLTSMSLKFIFSSYFQGASPNIASKRLFDLRA